MLEDEYNTLIGRPEGFLDNKEAVLAYRLITAARYATLFLTPQINEVNTRFTNVLTKIEEVLKNPVDQDWDQEVLFYLDLKKANLAQESLNLETNMRTIRVYTRSLLKEAVELTLQEKFGVSESGTRCRFWGKSCKI